MLVLRAAGGRVAHRSPPRKLIRKRLFQWVRPKVFLPFTRYSTELSCHLELIRDDPRYGWSTRQRRTGVRPSCDRPGGRASGRRERGGLTGEAG